MVMTMELEIRTCIGGTGPDSGLAEARANLFHKDGTFSRGMMEVRELIQTGLGSKHRLMVFLFPRWMSPQAFPLGRWFHLGRWFGSRSWCHSRPTSLEEQCLKPNFALTKFVPSSLRYTGMTRSY